MMRLLVPFILLIVTTLSLNAQPVLTSEKIKSFIDVYPQVRGWVKKATAEKRLVFKLVPNNKADMFTQTLIASRLDKEFNTLIKPYGFSDSSQYILTESAIQRVYNAVTKEKQLSALHHELKQKVLELERTPMPEREKIKKRIALHKQLSAAKRISTVTSSEKKMIAPYLPTLKKLLP